MSSKCDQIQSLDIRNLPDQVQMLALAMDLRQDGMLERADLTPIFGNSFDECQFSQLCDVLSGGDAQQISAGLWVLTSLSEVRLAQIIDRHIYPNLYDEEKLLTELEQEYEYMDDVFYAVLARCAALQIDLVPMLRAESILTYMANDVATQGHSGTNDPTIHAALQFGEWHQPYFVTDLEEEHGISIRCELQFFYDANQWQQLSDVLEQIKTLRPADFEKLNELVLISDAYGDLKHESKPGQMILPQPVGNVVDADDADSFQGFLFYEVAQALAYELIPQIPIDVATAYANLIPNKIQTNLSDLFADDYAQFLMSSGQVVSRGFVSSEGFQKTPSYQKRLKFFQEHFPLAS